MSINSGENTPRIAFALCAVAVAACTSPIASVLYVARTLESTPLIACVLRAVAPVGRTHYIAVARTVVDMGDWSLSRRPRFGLRSGEIVDCCNPRCY